MRHLAAVAVLLAALAATVRTLPSVPPTEPAPSPFAQKPRLERENRRADVEARLLRGERFSKIATEVGEKFGCGLWAIKADVRLVRAKMARPDPNRPARLVARLEGLATKAEAAGELAVAAECLAKAGRLLGLGTSNVNVAIDARRQAIVLNFPEPRHDRLLSDDGLADVRRELLRRVDALSGLPRGEGERRVVDAGAAPSPARRSAG